MDTAGSGHYPIGRSSTGSASFYTNNSPNHRHSFSLSHDHSTFNSVDAGVHSHSLNISAFNSATAGTHSHSFNLQAMGTLNKTTNNKSNVPSYYGLLKIMRIK